MIGIETTAAAVYFFSPFFSLSLSLLATATLSYTVHHYPSVVHTSLFTVCVYIYTLFLFLSGGIVCARSRVRACGFQENGFLLGLFRMMRSGGGAERDDSSEKTRGGMKKNK